MSVQVLFTLYGFLMLALVLFVRSEFTRTRKSPTQKSAYVDGWSMARDGWSVGKR
jgi:hypothetical protein